MGADGVTVAASNAGQPQSFVGQDYAFRPYFQQALSGQQGRFYGIGATTGLPGYFIADAVKDSTGQNIGVIAIKLDLSDLQDSWRNSGEQVLLANSDGVVLLASDPGWRYRAVTPLTDAQRAAIVQTRQFPGQRLDPLDWSPLNETTAAIGGREWLYLTSASLPNGWRLHYFANDDRAVALSWLATAALVILAGTAFVAFQVQRARRTARALHRSEVEEARLRQANARLAREIEDRKTAERRLERTQDELERAGRLTALGRLSASVTHELGQPIAAMRNHLAAAQINDRGRATLPGKIESLLDRMEGITRQLKFFARPDRQDFGQLDLRDALQAAADLIAPNLQTANARLDLSTPDLPVIIRGSRLRVEQVMTNLLRNAVDAVEDSPTRFIHAVLGQDDRTAWFELRDSGHGLAGASLADLQEPFVTTRESGRGMGLGLAISANIVRDHGGAMTATQGPDGGAVFRVTFPRSESGEENDHA